ncbi:MAG: AAA family ATPase [Haloechinothrix sp.]
MLVSRAYVPDGLRPDDLDAWPYTVHCVRELLDHDLTFTKPITFLVGENGSGKSTLVEAFAETYGLDARGGRAGRKYGNARPKTSLGEVLRLESTAEGARIRGGSRRGRKGYFLRAETAFGLMETVSGMHGYWEENTAEMSHGEGFLTVLSTMFSEPGLYLMDEPEAALSFTSCLRLVALMQQLGESGAQIVCATHSPVLAATPGADIIEIGEHGTRRVSWSQLELVNHWRRYLGDPDMFLRHLSD